MKCFYATSISHYAQQITTNKHKAMDSSAKNATMFLSQLRELSDFYNLFSSFDDADIPSDRREIILENLTYNMMKAEKKYMTECAATVKT